MSEEKCSALIEGKCKNGFRTTAPCHGMKAGLPICMREDVCGRLYEATGGAPKVITHYGDKP